MGINTCIGYISIYFEVAMQVIVLVVATFVLAVFADHLPEGFGGPPPPPSPRGKEVAAYMKTLDQKCQDHLKQVDITYDIKLGNLTKEQNSTIAMLATELLRAPNGTTRGGGEINGIKINMTNPMQFGGFVHGAMGLFEPLMPGQGGFDAWGDEDDWGEDDWGEDDDEGDWGYGGNGRWDPFAEIRKNMTNIFERFSSNFGSRQQQNRGPPPRNQNRGRPANSNTGRQPSGGATGGAPTYGSAYGSNSYGSYGAQRNGGRYKRQARWNNNFWRNRQQPNANRQPAQPTWRQQNAGNAGGSTGGNTGYGYQAPPPRQNGGFQRRPFPPPPPMDRSRAGARFPQWNATVYSSNRPKVNIVVRPSSTQDVARKDAVNIFVGAARNDGVTAAVIEQLWLFQGRVLDEVCRALIANNDLDSMTTTHAPVVAETKAPPAPNTNTTASSTQLSCRQCRNGNLLTCMQSPFVRCTQSKPVCELVLVGANNDVWESVSCREVQACGNGNNKNKNVACCTPGNCDVKTGQISAGFLDLIKDRMTSN